MRLTRTPGLFLLPSVLLHSSLLHSQTRCGLSCPNRQCHSHALISYTLLSCLPSEAAVLAQPMGKPEPLCWLNLCGNIGVGLPARNKGMRGTFWYILVHMRSDAYIRVHSSYLYIQLCTAILQVQTHTDLFYRYHKMS